MADNFNATDKIAMGPGKIYVGLAIPGAGGRLILNSSGEPDPTQNPSALHLGYTESGVEFRLGHTLTGFTPDEATAPVISRIQSEEASLSGALMQILDFDIFTVMHPLSTRSNLAGTQGATFGGKTTFSYQSVAVIFPLEGSSGPVIYGVFHLYQAVNDQGVAAKVTKTSPGYSPFGFKGHEIPTRTAGDRIGRAYRQTAGAAS